MPTARQPHAVASCPTTLPTAPLAALTTMVSPSFGGRSGSGRTRRSFRPPNAPAGRLSSADPRFDALVVDAEAAGAHPGAGDPPSLHAEDVVGQRADEYGTGEMDSMTFATCFFTLPVR
jgi:hypothetical protein